VHPWKKKKKMLGIIGWVGSFGVAEAGLWLILSLKDVHLIDIITIMAIVWLQIK